MNLNPKNFKEYSSNIDFVREYIDENEHLFQPLDDSEVIAVLQKNYRLSKESIEEFCDLLSGHRKESLTSKKEADKVLKNLEAYCHIIGVKMLTRDENGEQVFMIDRLKNKISSKKSSMKKIFSESEEKN